MFSNSPSDVRYQKRARLAPATQRNELDRVRLFAPAVQRDDSMYTLISVIIIGVLFLLGVLNGVFFLID